MSSIQITTHLFQNKTRHHLIICMFILNTELMKGVMNLQSEITSNTYARSVVNIGVLIDNGGKRADWQGKTELYSVKTAVDHFNELSDNIYINLLTNNTKVGLLLTYFTGTLQKQKLQLVFRNR